jgi:hypothetical protein
MGTRMSRQHEANIQSDKGFLSINIHVHKTGIADPEDTRHPGAT